MPRWEGSHGNVVPRVDGQKLLCGGPRECIVCAAELARLKEDAKGTPVLDEFSDYKFIETRVEAKRDIAMTPMKRKAAVALHVVDHWFVSMEGCTIRRTAWELHRRNMGLGADEFRLVLYVADIDIAMVTNICTHEVSIKEFLHELEATI